MNVKVNAAADYLGGGLLFTVGQIVSSNTTNTYNVDNCYGYGNFEQATASGTTTKKALPFIGLYAENVASGSKYAKTITNCKVYSDYISNGFLTNSKTSPYTASMSTAVNNAAASSLSELKTAVTGVLNNPEVWDTSVLNSISASSKPNIVSSPILINRLRIAYYEYKKVGANLEDVPYANAYGAGETAGDWKTVKVDDMLAQPDYDAGQVPTGRIFLGWTNDKTGKSEPYMTVPNTWHGDNKIYAVWGIANGAGVNADISISARNGNVSLTYDEGDAETAAKGYNIVYNTYGITLTASNSNLTITGTDKNDFAGYEYAWMKYDKDEGIYKEASSGSANAYTVSNVKDSGDYKVAVKYRSASEPLFMGEIETDAKKVTILKAPLKCTGVTFNDKKPYSQAPFSEVKPTATVTLASGGKTIPGTTEWVDSLGYINKNYKDTNVKDGWETKLIRFKPTGEYADNYGTDGEDGAIFEIKFEIQYLKLIFDIEGSSVGSSVVGQLEYDQQYSYNAIADKFETAFKSLMDLLDGDSPVFVMENGDTKTIEEYRKLGSSNGNYNAYEHVKEDVTIQVQFKPIEYTIKFDLNGGNMGADPETGDPRTTIEDQKYHYGNHLTSLPNPQNEQLLFLGWFYDVEEKNESGQTVTVPTAWNFDSDRVTKSMSLYARWLAADKLEKLEVTFTPDAAFKAREAITPNMLVVKATFTGTENGVKHTLTSILPYGGIEESGKYWIVYDKANPNASVLHVKLDENGNPLKSSIFVYYRFGGENHSAESPKFDIERIKL
ncbi:MAG: InlB B-repeat-containing protein, partial [Clostridiales bacterium]|nr:InlB B-repeat-containing protein [Clostridiales bacterium]